MPVTDDPNDPRLGHGVDAVPVPQQEVYLVLSKAERKKGFVRPYRDRYIHVGAPPPSYPLHDLTDEQKMRYGDLYAKYEEYPDSEAPALGKFWTQAQLDNVGKGCGTETIMGRALSETYAVNPSFYGMTYCTGCMKHLPVEEFVWSVDNQRLGS
jgi:hypothetical protein